MNKLGKTNSYFIIAMGTPYSGVVSVVSGTVTVKPSRFYPDFILMVSIKPSVQQVSAIPRHGAH